MSPWAVIICAIGFLMIVIGFTGSQHHVMDAFKGVKQGQTSVPKGA